MTQTVPTAHPPLHAPGTPSWVDLSTHDPEGACAFYAPLFGWTYDLSGPELGGYATANVQDRAAAGIGGVMEPGGAQTGVWSLYFASADVRADAVRVAELGGTVLTAPFTVEASGAGDEPLIVGHMGVFADPGGAMFALWQPGIHPGSRWTDADGPGGMAWPSLYTRDEAACLPFYAALLGAEVQPLTPGHDLLVRGGQPLARVFGLSAGGGMPAPAWTTDAPAQWVVCFRAPNTERAAAQAAATGGRVLEAVQTSPYGRMAVLADPQGAVFGVVEGQRE